MKKAIQIILVLFLIVCDVNAQQEKGITGFNSWLNNWTEFKPQKVEYGEVSQILTGNISVNTQLYKKYVYLLQGNVYVTDSAILTIEPGTVIMGDGDSKASLIITKGAAIIANGLETDPIVFTSNRSFRAAGDWGGLVLLGDGPINKQSNASSIDYGLEGDLSHYGGLNPKSNSGILRYVRIEFAGAKPKGTDVNFSGLLLAGVGSETIFENVMVSFCAGNSFEALGGEVNLKKMVSLKSAADDYKFNYGVQCYLENSLAVRSSYLANYNGSRCMNVLSFDKKSEINFSKKQTKVTARNITFVNNSDNVKNDIDQGLIKEGVYVGENTSVDFVKSVISGFNPAILFDKNIVIDDANLKKIQLQQMYFNLCRGNIFISGNPNNEDLENWYGNAGFANVYSKAENLETFIDPNNKRPDYRLRIGRITVSKDD